MDKDHKPSLGDGIRTLVKSGYTYREIMDITGLKSTSAIAHHAKNVHKHRFIDRGDFSWECRGCELVLLDSRAAKFKESV